MKPNFLVIGAGKCGTTSLCHWLSQHPDVFFSDPKETGFFSEDYHKGIRFYESYFLKAKGATAIGEGSVNYSKSHCFPDACQRIFRHLPDARLIYVTRHPMERIASEWRYRSVNLDESLPFSDAIRANPDYVQTSEYNKQLGRFLAFYPVDRVMVLFLRDIKESPDVVLSKCFEFLGIDTSFVVAKEPKNVSNEIVGSGRALRRLRRLPGFRRWRNIIPRSVRSASWRLLGRRHCHDTFQVSWDDALLADTTQRLENESKEFLKNWGKQADFWEFGGSR